MVVLAVTAMMLAGCNLASNLMHGLGVDMIPADYKGLEESKVAVITLTDSTQYSNDIAGKELSRKVSEILTLKVDKIKLIREEEVERYRDINGWDSTDYVEIGKSVGAEKVLGIELSNLKLREGQTLFQGNSQVRVSVIDVATGTVLYTRSIDEFQYPTLAGQDATGTTESRFRRLYLTMLAQEISRSFHRYDMTDRFAIDSKYASH
jgi:hypothetical protein